MNQRGMRRAAAVAVALAGAGLAACGGDDGDGGQATATQPPAAQATVPADAVEVRLSAVEQGGLSFSEESLQVAPGQVTLTMRNPRSSRLPHAIAVEGGNGQSRQGPAAEPGRTSSVTVGLVPGEYTFYCPLGDHRARGMTGVLIVE